MKPVRILVLVTTAVLAVSNLAGSAARAPSRAPRGATASADPRIARAIDAYARPLLERGDLSGQLLVLRHGRVVAERAWGKANLELNVPVTPETRFNVASVTKPMTATIAIQLITEKKLGANDSIARWIPDFPSGDSITVSLLLRHRSGIPHEIMPDSEMTKPFTAAEIVERAKRLPLDFRPGARESYSSGGYEVLARVLELASGKSYGELLAERILNPLGMTHTAHIDRHMLTRGHAIPYVPGPHGIEKAPFQDFSGLVGAGSVWSTARDLHRFVQAIVSGKLGETVRQSFVRHGRLDFNGRTSGFKAWAMWDSATTIEAIFVGNVATGAPDALKGDVLRLAAGESVPPPSPPALRADALPESELRRWVGVYQLGNGVRLDVHLVGSTLYSNDWVMLPAADGSMFSPRDYGVIRAVPGADGRLERLDWIQNGETYPAPRVGESGK
jgi:CubicO group peptidase (beta-lactamase class C family)